MARGQQKIQSQQKNAERQENGRNLIENLFLIGP